MGLLQTIGILQNVQMGRLPKSSRFQRKILIKTIITNYTSQVHSSTSAITSSFVHRAWFTTTLASNVQSMDMREDRLTLDWLDFILVQADVSYQLIW